MKFDEHGHVMCSPKSLYEFANAAARHLVNGYLLAGTPWAFAEYDGYRDFLEAVAERTGVHPKNLYVRGSCQLGFSIAPRQSAWMAMRNGPRPKASDLDLVIVDERYFTYFEREVRWWEDRNPGEILQGRAAEAFERRQQDRRFNCCRDEALPHAICIHHQDTMQRVAQMKHCGLHRELSAFIYPDWHSARQRYEYDLRKLVEGVESGRLPPPGDEPVPVEAVAVGQEVASQFKPDDARTILGNDADPPKSSHSIFKYSKGLVSWNWRY